MFDLRELLAEFRNKVSGMPEASQRNYGKALRSFETFCGVRGVLEATPSAALFADWAVHMWMLGLTAKTAAHYIDILAALFNNVCGASVDLCVLKAQLRGGDAWPDSAGLKRDLERLHALARSATSGRSAAADLVLMALICGALPLEEVARMKKTDVDSTLPEAAAIAERRSSGRRSYLFDLEQSSLTPRRLARRVDAMATDALRMHGLSAAAGADATLAALWACAALGCGIAPAEVAAAMGTRCDALPVLALCRPAELSAGRRAEIVGIVAATFASNPLRWYAMRLRPRVSYEEIAARLDSLGSEVRRPELFYPYDEIARRIGRKLVFDRRPVIRDIVFFRTRLSEVCPLFCRIGDLAWCYTTSGRPGGAYAAIAPDAFARFQETIGHFTPDYDVEPLGATAPAEGETVVVVNRLFPGCEFDIEKIESGSANALFRLHMVGDNGIQWRLHASGRQIHPTR